MVEWREGEGGLAGWLRWLIVVGHDVRRGWMTGSVREGCKSGTVVAWRAELGEREGPTFGGVRRRGCGEVAQL